MLKSFLYYIKKPNRIIRALGAKGYFNFMSDKNYLKILYFVETGSKLNLIKPELYNEKLQWLKLYDHNPLYPKLVDKFEVRQYVKDKIGDKYLIPLLAEYDKPKDIEWEKLPNQFVIKTTHGSYTNIICKDKSKLNKEKSVNLLNHWMQKSWFWRFREWPYSQITPRIIIEKYMVDESGTELKDYKFFCFNGNVEFVQVDFGRFTNHKRNIYDLNWNLLPVEIENPSDPEMIIEKPKKIKEMTRIAEKLSKGFAHARIDLYSINEEVFFGEITFYHGGGFQKIKPIEFEKHIGNLIKINQKNYQ